MTGVLARVRLLAEQSRRVIEAGSTSRLSLSVGSRVIRLVGDGAALLEFCGPAFAHLERVDDGFAADLAVWMWDAASTGRPFPELDVAVPAGHGAAVVHEGDESFVLHPSDRALTYLDRRTGQALYVVDDPARLPPWDRPAPLRTLLSWWFASEGMLLAHAAAVGTEDGAVLLVGPGGSGKSSTALGCLAAGMGYLGDDYVLLDPAKGSVWSVFGSAKLVPGHLERFPGLMTPEPLRSDDSREVKLVGWPSIEHPDRMTRTAMVRAFVIPTVTNGPECTLAPTSAGRALMALAPTTMFQTPGGQRTAFDRSVEIVRGLVPYRLALGAGADAVPEMLASLIREWSGR
jgi:hypothetical protein